MASSSSRAPPAATPAIPPQKPERHHKRMASTILKAIAHPRSHREENETPSSHQQVLGHTKPTGENHLAKASRIKSSGALAAPGPTRSQPIVYHTPRQRSTKPAVEIYDEQNARPAMAQLHKATSTKRAQKHYGDEVENELELADAKSSGFAALLTRSRSTKQVASCEPQQKDKENQSPPGSSGQGPPIWRQFASQQENATTQKVPLNDSWDVEDEVKLYTAHEYSPSKGRNFGHQPTLARKPEPKSKPGLLSKSASSSLVSLAMLRKPSISSEHSAAKSQTKGQEAQPTNTPKQKASRPVTREGPASHETAAPGLTVAKRGSRVMAAVAVWNGKGKDNVPPAEAPMDAAAFDAAFEDMLESRNVAAETREKMRHLDHKVKADLIKGNHHSSPFVPEFESTEAGLQAPQNEARADDIKNVDGAESNKKSRPRSLTFTFHKGEQSLKKKKSSQSIHHSRNKSADSSSTTTRSLSSGATSQGGLFSRAAKPATPDDFVSYLRKVSKPQLVEVGRLQKLRQLLRNEAVEWVDAFIMKGGMAEIEALLYRTIAIEWREDHEDNLLHHTLTCLKALLTTSLALEHLASIQEKLFPALLRLLFSSGDDKRGPSEFSTRGVIIALLFTYLSSAPAGELEPRARTLCSYLKDPTPKETDLPPGFIASIYRPRPYKLWAKEISNTTKEVFWIFLHHVNVIPLPPPSAADENLDAAAFIAAFFPPARVPVPAAPYVGGVEWEATNYLATHLDLLNGLVAALPTRTERNDLRRELRDSGLERTMGAALRTCKQKFYGGVHAGLATWCTAARADGWEFKDVREGPVRGDSPRKGTSPAKKKAAGGKEGDGAPVLQVPGLEGEREECWL